MDLKHIIANQRRRKLGSSLDADFINYSEGAIQTGPSATFTRPSSGTFVNENGVIVGKTKSTTTLVAKRIIANSSVITITVPSGSVVGWLNGSVVNVMQDLTENDIHTDVNDGDWIIGTILHKSDTTLTLKVTNRIPGPSAGAVSNWVVSYRGLRRDHDPMTRKCHGILLEGQRQNLITKSGLMHTWGGSPSTVQNGSTVVISPETCPDGTNSAALLTSGTSSYAGFLRSPNPITLAASGTIYTVSVFVKKGNWSYVSPDFAAFRGEGGSAVPFFNLDTGEFDANGSSVTSGRIEPYPNGWKRLIMTGPRNSTTSFPTVTGDLILTSSTGISNSAIGTGHTVHAWGYQIELSAAATSYVPTGLVTALRASDAYTISGTNFTNLWNPSGGTFYIECALARNPATNNLKMLSDRGANRRWLYGNFPGKNNSTEVLAAYDGTNVPIYLNDVRLTNKNKIAISVESTKCTASLNGGATGSITHTGTLLNSVDDIAVFEDSFGTITKIKYYRKILDNAKLAELTTTSTQDLVFGTEALTFANDQITLTI